MMSKLFVSVILIFCCIKINAQKWTASSFDVSISSIGFDNKIQDQLKNEFLNYYAYENKFNYEEAKKAKINNSNNRFGQTCANFNYVLKKNTDILFFKNVLFTSGLNLNFWNDIENDFYLDEKIMSNDTNVKSAYFYKISNRETRKGLGFNVGLSLLSKPFLQNLKLQVGVMNIFCPMTSVKYYSPKVHAEEFSEGIQNTYYSPVIEEYKTTGKLMNHTQLKIGIRCNVDCTGNLFLNYIGNFSIYKGKPDIQYTGFSQGFEFGINFLLSNEEKSLESSGGFW